MGKISDHTNACTLVAVQEASGLEDDLVMAAFSRHGWVSGQGMYTENWVAAAKELDIQLEVVNIVWTGRGGTGYLGYPTVAQTMTALSPGTYIFTAAQHAFVVRNGWVVDPNFRNARMARRRVIACHRVLNPRTVERPQLTSTSVIKFVTPPDMAKRRYTAGWRRYRSAYDYMAVIRGLWETGLCLQNLMSETEYTWADAVWDYTRGHIKIS